MNKRTSLGVRIVKLEEIVRRQTLDKNGKVVKNERGKTKN